MKLFNTIKDAKAVFAKIRKFNTKITKALETVAKIQGKDTLFSTEYTYGTENITINAIGCYSDVSISIHIPYGCLTEEGELDLYLDAVIVAEERKQKDLIERKLEKSAEYFRQQLEELENRLANL